MTDATISEMAKTVRYAGVRYAVRIENTEKLSSLFHDIREANDRYSASYPQQCFIETHLPAQPVRRSSWSVLGHTWFSPPLLIHLHFQQMTGGDPRTISAIVQQFEERWKARSLEGAMVL